MELPKSGFLSTVFSALLSPVVRAFDRPALPHYDGELILGNLRHPVRVSWDHFAVPHVTATNEHDLFFAQGYLHAQERLWQMEMSRRFLAGRMAEIFGDFALPWKELSAQFRGKNTVEFDYFVRLLGIGSAAATSLSLVDESEQTRLNAYSAGVNAYIERCGNKLPWEFRVLRHAPEPWRPLDTLMIGKGFAFLLSPALYTRLNLIAIAARLKNSPEKLRTLLPGYSENGPTIAQALWDQSRGLWQFISGSLAASDWHAAGHGSNNWVVAPHRSTSGRAILSNDPHLRMTMPSTWYMMHLRADNDSGHDQPFEIWGASIPGTLAIQIGHNRAIAWGITAAVCDDVEIYREKLHPVEPDLFLTENRWEKFAVRRETIAVRGQRSIEKSIRWSCHGPVISDFTATSTGKEVLAVRWTAHESSHELRGQLALNHARNWPEFLDALRWHSAPSLNFVYADREGNIGYTLAGKLPRRNQVPTLLPLEGWKKSNDWAGYLPFDALPRIYNPPEGVLATANQRIVDASYPFYLSHFFEPPFRIRRIEQLLAAQQKFSPRDFQLMQLDTLSLHAKEFIEIIRAELLALEQSEPIVEAAAHRLLQWDGNCTEDSVAATIFHALHQRLLRNLLSPDLDENLLAAYVEILNQSIVPTDAIMGNPDSIWFTRRSRTALVRSSLRDACAELTVSLGANIEKWHWGKIHRLQINHALGRNKLLTNLLGVGPLAAAGDGMTINFGFYRHSNPYMQTVGPSLRFNAELTQQPNSGFVLPTGQSGHPLSAHYRDQTARWRLGASIPLASDNPELPRAHHLLLKPV